MPLLLNFLYVAISRVMFGDHLRKIPLYKGQNWNHLYAMTYDVELKYFFELYDKHEKFKRPILARIYWISKTDTTTRLKKPKQPNER